MTLIKKLINEHNQVVQYTEERQYKDGFLAGMSMAIDIAKKHNSWISVDDDLPKQFEKVLLSGQNTMNDFGLFASETEIIECPYCQYEFSLDDIECVDEKIQAENMIENERKGTLMCTNHDCKKPFYFEGFIEYRYASKKLESENEQTNSH